MSGAVYGSSVGTRVMQSVGVATVLLTVYNGEISFLPIVGAYTSVVEKFFDGDELAFHSAVCYFVLINLSAALIALLTGVKAPYGRYASSAFGPPVATRLSWVVQEMPVLCWAFWCMKHANFNPFQQRTATILATLISVHYFNRTCVWPFRLRVSKPAPLVVVLLAYLFCACNGFIQFRYLALYSDYDDENYEYFSPRFVVGVIIFFLGLIINNHSDTILLNLRPPGDTGYYIPRGGMFEFISGANFFGEIVEWLGFAIAANSLPAWTFAIGTAFNIAPRAITHHKWYLQKFEDYPKDRKAVIPFIF